jgi:CTP synthase
LRSETELPEDIRKKIALFASVPVDAIVSAKDVNSIYEVPLWYHEQGVDEFIMDYFGIEDAPDADLAEWASIVSAAARAEKTVKIALVGKYVALEDAYMSVSEALSHSGAKLGVNVEIDWVDSETLESDKEALKRLGDADGILIPGGFGGRGIEGKIRAAKVAREQKIPYLGVCLGMQIAVAEFARHVAGMEGANSTEFDIETEWPVIDLLPEQKEVSDLGGTMRLGADPVKLHEGTRTQKIYGEAVIYERHRHRYEVSISLRKKLEHAGLVVSGTSPDERLVEAIEINDHPFFVAAQFHPEFKSRPETPAPMFYGFVEAAATAAGSDSESEPVSDSSAARA